MTGPHADRVAEAVPPHRRTSSVARPAFSTLAAAGAPVAGGLLLAWGVISALRAWLPDATLIWSAALAGACAWVYLGLTPRLGRLLGGTNLLAAAALFAMAILSRGADAPAIATLVGGHALWGLVLAWQGRRDRDANSSVWIGWCSFHATLAFSLLQA